MTAAVTIEDLSFDYEDFRALRSVTTTIRAGAITALVGPNGAGKTTLMRCVCGLARPVMGRVVTLGVDVFEDARAARRKVGYLPDFIGLYGDLSVRRALRHAAARQGLRGRAERAATDWAIEALNLAALTDRRGAELSRGQRQRTAIGMAIIHKPELLVLDEPASGLDPEAREELAGLLRRLRDELGATLLVSSHILAELDAYAEEALILDQGRLVDSAPIRGAAGAPGGETQWIVIETAGEDAGRLAERLGGLRVERLDARRLRAMGPAAPAERAKLLETLIRNGAAIASFAPERESLQEVYVARMRAAREDGR